jgi:outer membrane protein assembly factor BamE (lipoprotein component of BamABCDE complex)
MTLTKKIVAVVLAAAIALSCLAACGTTASVVNRNPDSKRGTSIHSGF